MGLQRVGHDWRTFTSLHFTSLQNLQLSPPKEPCSYFVANSLMIFPYDVDILLLWIFEYQRMDHWQYDLRDHIALIIPGKSKACWGKTVESSLQTLCSIVNKLLTSSDTKALGNRQTFITSLTLSHILENKNTHDQNHVYINDNQTEKDRCLNWDISKVLHGLIYIYP